MVASRHNPAIKVFYEKLSRAGKAKEVAFVASMRKLPVIMCTMFKNDSTWNPKIVESQGRIKIVAVPDCLSHQKQSALVQDA